MSRGFSRETSPSEMPSGRLGGCARGWATTPYRFVHSRWPPIWQSILSERPLHPPANDSISASVSRAISPTPRGRHQPVRVAQRGSALLARALERGEDPLGRVEPVDPLHGVDLLLSRCAPPPNRQRTMASEVSASGPSGSVCVTSSGAAPPPRRGRGLCLAPAAAGSRWPAEARGRRCGEYSWELAQPALLVVVEVRVGLDRLQQLRAATTGAGLVRSPPRTPAPRTASPRAPGSRRRGGSCSAAPPRAARARVRRPRSRRARRAASPGRGRCPSSRPGAAPSARRSRSRARPAADRATGVSSSTRSEGLSGSAPWAASRRRSGGTPPLRNWSTSGSRPGLRSSSLPHHAGGTGPSCCRETARSAA